MDIRNFFGAKNGSALKSKSEAKDTLKAINKPYSKDSSNNTLTPQSLQSTSSSDSGSNTKENEVVSKSDASSIVPGRLPKELQDIIAWPICSNNSTPNSEGGIVPYLALVDSFENISKHSGRLDKESIFTKFFKAVILTAPDDLLALVYLSSNAIAPAYEGMELGIGDSLLVKAICEATGRKREAVEEDYKREGDLGVVALLSRTSQKTLSFASKPKPLTAVYVLNQLRKITDTKGENAQSRKVNIIKSIMVRCQGQEAKYIVRSLQGKLRIGTAEQTVLVSIAQAFAQATLAHEDDISSSADDCDVDETEDSTSKTTRIDNSTVHENGSMLSLIDTVVESEPCEAKTLREKGSKLPKDKLNELAAIVVKRAFSECPSLDVLIKALLTNPLYNIHKVCRLIPGVPVAPMLAKPTKEIGEVLKRLSGMAFTMEYKYDGERAQVHLLPNGDVKIFSRNSEDNSNKYPDITEVVRKAKKEGVESCVFDAEVVAFDREKGCLLPFQILSTRKRKVDEGEEDNQKVKVVLQAFDMLYINGKSLLTQSLRKRREILHSTFNLVEGYFYFASGLDHVENGDTLPIETFLQEACSAMCEGLMVKTLDNNASYEPSKRSLNWLKLKKDYIEGMGICDSVDLVVIGGYHGRGKRVNVYGAYLMACYDPESDEFQSVCKVGTGFKDEDLIKLTEKTKPLVIGSKKRPINYNVGDALEPDDWFDASVVWEIQAADLSKSSVHKGAIGKVDQTGERGVGLRFPRFIRERDDKAARQATNSEQIADLYFSQEHEQGNSGKAGVEDEDEDFI